MNAENLGAIRTSAELQNFQPYMDAEIAQLQRAVVSFILAATNNGTLTPDIALSKWIEYISYTKLQQKIAQRIRVGQSVGEKEAPKLDLPAPIGYTSSSLT